MTRIAYLVLAVLWSDAATCLCAKESAVVIYDTEMSTDCGDAGALAILHALADAGEVVIAGVVLSGSDKAGASAATVDAINTYYGRPDLPIGVGRDRGFTTESAFTEEVRDGFPHDQPADRDVEAEAVALYRRLLSQAEYGGVSIVCSGYLTNLRGLIESKADQFSKLDGKALVRAKVKGLTVVGGEFPSGSEFNLRGGIGSARAGDAARVMEAWPEEVEVVFVGFEVGKGVRTGIELLGTPDQNPVKRIYGVTFDSLRFGRPSWALIGVLYAVRGAREYWGLVDRGSVGIDADGANRWVERPDKNQGYLVTKMPGRELGFVLGELMSRSPGGGGESLVGHWPFHGSVEDVAGGNDGKAANGVGFVGENGRWALSLDGRDDFAEIPAVEALALSGFSIAVWVKAPADAVEGWRTVYEHGRETDNWHGLWRNEGGEHFHFRWGKRDTADFVGKVREGEWQHVVATVDSGKGEVRLYLDGKLDRKLENVRVPRPSAQKMCVGSNILGEEHFEGMISDLRVYRVPLSDEEVEELAKKAP